MDEREGLVKNGKETLGNNYKDQKFYAGVCKEILEVGAYQRKLFKEHAKKGTQFDVNGSLASLLGFCATNNDGAQSDIAKTLKKELKLNDEIYNQMVIYYFAKEGQW
jgi:methyltransferase-like protein